MVVVLPAPFGPQQAKANAGAHREVDAIHGIHAGVVFVQIAHFQNRLRHLLDNSSFHNKPMPTSIKAAAINKPPW